MRTGLALALSLACALLLGAPAAAHAGLGKQVLFHAAASPSDPWYRYQWGLENAGRSSLFPTAAADADIDAQQAWDDTESGEGAGVTVAVVDTRIDTTNADIAPQLSATPAGPAPSNGADCPAGTPAPDHGTAVAAVVAAAHNADGIAGVAPEAKILPVPALDDCGGGTPDSVMAALQYAVGHEAQVVVASFGTDPLLGAADKAALAARFDAFFAAHATTLFVVAAGNEGNDDDVNPVYPCSSDASNLLCVGASGMDDSPACETNVGANSVDLFAPGEDIYSDGWSVGLAHPRVLSLSGTSMAAPLAAGVAALVQPTLFRPNGERLAEAVRGGVDPRNAMAPISRSGGRLNAAVALGLPADDGALAVSQGSPWQSCDQDHDGVVDARDNCPAAYDPGQADADGDGVGDACDTTPRGPDPDGDGVGALDDRCPNVPAPTSDGCPAVVANPTPTPSPPPVATPSPSPTIVPLAAPRIVSVAVKVARSRRSARVTVRLSRTLPAAVTVERRVSRHHHRVWQRVLRRSLTVTARGRAMTVRTQARGSYRVTVRVTGARTVRRAFRV